MPIAQHTFPSEPKEDTTKLLPFTDKRIAPWLDWLAELGCDLIQPNPEYILLVSQDQTNRTITYSLRWENQPAHAN